MVLGVRRVTVVAVVVVSVIVVVIVIVVVSSSFGVVLCWGIWVSVLVTSPFSLT